MMGVLRRRERMRDYLALWKRFRAIIFSCFACDWPFEKRSTSLSWFSSARLKWASGGQTKAYMDILISRK